jgi:hypothetical protein
MAKQPVDLQVTALEALSRMLVDATPRLLFKSASSPGFFSGTSQPVKAAANLCKERGWLEPTGEFVGTGKSKKEKYRLTPTAVHAILEGSEAVQLLRGLNDHMKAQIESLKNLQAQIGLVLNQAGPLGDAVAALQRRLQPPNLDDIRRQLGPAAPVAAPTPPAVAPAAPLAAWLDRVLTLINQQRERDRFQQLNLPALWQQLRQGQPDLTLGQFHDGLRTLRDQGRIRLVPFTRALATIEDPRNALFLDGEVMYYVDLP